MKDERAIDEPTPASASPAPATTAPAARPSVGQTATRGLFWMTLASVAAKAVGFAQLIVLAWFLKVEDFGLLTMANTVVAFAVIPLRFGLEEILIQRFRRFHLWSGPAFWLSLSAGLGTMLILILAAPLGAWFYDSWRVAMLMVVLAAVTPMTAAMAVPFAKLSAELRFRAQAALSVVQIISQTVIAVPLAAAGAGAMSVAVASLTSATIVTIAYWHLSGLPVPRLDRRHGLGVRRWRYFVRDSAMLQGTRLATAVASNVDFIILGRLGGAGPLGIYSYAYNQSLQAMRLVATNAAGVLFPSLSQFGDDDRRKYDAFLRGMRLVLPVLIPFCAAQAALADPAFRVLFKPEYWPGIPLFQILSLGCVGVGAGMLGQSCLLSLRRNDLVFAYAAIGAAAYVVLIPIGYVTGGVVGVAWAATAVAIGAIGLVHALVARACHRPVGHAVRAYVRPVAIAAVSGGATWLLAGRAPAEVVASTGASPMSTAAPLLRLFVGGAAFVALYMVALRLIDPRAFAEIWRIAVAPVRARLARPRPPLDSTAAPNANPPPMPSNPEAQPMSRNDEDDTMTRLATAVRTRALAGRPDRLLWLAARRALIRFAGDPATRFDVAGKSIAMPLSHMLPAYARGGSLYDTALERLGRFCREESGRVVAIDVGANVGDTLARLGAASPGPDDFFVGVEPDPRYGGYFERNWAGHDKVRLVRCICAAQSAAERRVVIDASAGTAVIRDVAPANSDAAGTAIAARTVDEIVDAEPALAGGLNVLKVDTDGFDFEVLRGAAATLARRRPAVFMECDAFYMPTFADDVRGFFATLTAAGYRRCLAYDNGGHLIATLPLDQPDRLFELALHRLTAGRSYLDLLAMPEPAMARFRDRELLFFAGVAAAPVAAAALAASLRHASGPAPTSDPARTTDPAPTSANSRDGLPG